MSDLAKIILSSIAVSIIVNLIIHAISTRNDAKDLRERLLSELNDLISLQNKHITMQKNQIDQMNELLADDQDQAAWECVECKYMDRGVNEHPCNRCSHNCTSQFKRRNRPNYIKP